MNDHKKEKPLVERRFILHPPYTQPAHLKNRMICQLIANVKGKVSMYAQKDNEDCIAFEGTKAEELQIQYLADIHISSFWQRVEILYKEYIEEHGLYCKEDEMRDETLHQLPESAVPVLTTIEIKQTHKKNG
jgi:hypothetical protein